MTTHVVAWLSETFRSVPPRAPPGSTKHTLTKNRGSQHWLTARALGRSWFDDTVMRAALERSGIDGQVRLLPPVIAEGNVANSV